MKKFLALFLALLMCVGVFAGCGTKTDDSAVTLEQAKDYLYNVMKDKNGKALPNDYDVVGKIIIEEVSFDVTWTTDNEDIKVKESSKANMWTIDLPDFNETEVEYTLTATIKAEDGSTIEVSFTPKLPVIDNRGVSTDLEEGVAYKIYFEQVNLGYTLYALNTTQDGKNKFIEATLDPKEAADFYVEVVDGGYKVYTEIDGVKNYLHATATPKTDGGTGFTKAIGFATESDCVFFYDSEKLTYMVTIAGQTFGVGTYNAFETISISENTYFKNDNINVAGGQFPIGFMEAEYAETVAPDEKPVTNDPAADSTLTIAEAIALGETKVKDQYTEGKYYVTGKITSITSTTYGNMMISDGTNEILVYGTFDADGTNRFDKMANQPKVGDTVTVYGIVGMYNDAQLKNAWITNIVPGEGGEVTPPADEPAADSTLTIVEAIALGNTKTKNNYTTGKYYVTGVITSITNTTYGNMMISDGTNEILVYGTYDADGTNRFDAMANKPAVGDTITVYGVVGMYNAAQLKNAWITSIVPGEGGEVTPPADEPAADSTLTIVEAIALGNTKTKNNYTTGKYYVTGVITSITNTTYGNMMISDGTNEILVYGTYDADGTNRFDAMANKPAVGDTITVYGVVGMYNAAQLKNAWITSIVAGEGGEDDGGDVTPPADEPANSVVIADYATANSWSNSTLYSSLNIGSDVTVSVSAGTVGSYGQNTGKYYTSDTSWRIYQNENPSITITAAGKTITSVKITYTPNKDGVLLNGETQVASDTVVTVNAESITFGVGNSGDATNGQVRITAIEVIYA